MPTWLLGWDVCFLDACARRDAVHATMSWPRSHVSCSVSIGRPSGRIECHELGLAGWW